MNYLETRYPAADAAEKAHFAEILKLDDVELLMRRDVYWSRPPQK